MISSDKSRASGRGIVTNGEVTPTQMRLHQASLERRKRLWKDTPAPRIVIPPAPPAVSFFGAPITLIRVSSFTTIIGLVALRHNISFADIMSTDRTPHIVVARHQAIVLVHSHCNVRSWKALGRMFGMDHSSIIHAVRKAQGRPLKPRGPRK